MTNQQQIREHVAHWAGVLAAAGRDLRLHLIDTCGDQWIEAHGVEGFDAAYAAIVAECNQVLPEPMVASIFGSPKRGFFIYTHAVTEPLGVPAAGPYATKAEAKRKYRLSYGHLKAWNF